LGDRKSIWEVTTSDKKSNYQYGMVADGLTFQKSLSSHYI